MSKTRSQKEIDSDYQNTWDALSVSSNAATLAKARYENAYQKAAERSIKVAHDESGEVEEGYIMHNIYFDPTDEEREEIRNAYTEWQALKIIHKEKIEEWNFVKRHGKLKEVLDLANENLSEAKMELIELIMKIVFYITVFVAAVIIIYSSVF